MEAAPGNLPIEFPTGFWLANPRSIRGSCPHAMRTPLRTGVAAIRRCAGECRSRRGAGGRSTPQPCQCTRHRGRMPPDPQFSRPRNAHASHPMPLLHPHAGTFPSRRWARMNEAAWLFELKLAGTELPSVSRTVTIIRHLPLWFPAKRRSRRCALTLAALRAAEN